MGNGAGPPEMRAGDAAPTSRSAIFEEARRGLRPDRHRVGRGRVDRRPGRRGGRRRSALPRRDHEGRRAAADRGYKQHAGPGRRQRRLAHGGRAGAALRRGDGRALTLAVLTERRPQAAAYADMSGTHVPAEVARRPAPRSWSASRSSFRASDVKPTILHLAYDPRSSAVAAGGREGALRPGRPRRREPRHPAPALLRLRERAAHPGHARAGRRRRPQLGRLTAPRGSRVAAMTPPEPRFVFMGGGARSGKSRCALARASASGDAGCSSPRPSRSTTKCGCGSRATARSAAPLSTPSRSRSRCPR